MLPDFTASVGAPRVAGIAHPFSLPMGKPHDRERQAEVLAALLELAGAAREPGTVVHLPFAWPEPRSRGIGAPPTPAPIVLHLKRKPWQLLKLLSGEIPDAERD